MKSKTELEDKFLHIVKDLKLPEPEREFKFHDKRRWRLDFCWPDKNLAVEIEGGIWVGGRHINPQGFIKDLEKYNEVSLHGYTLLRFSPEALNSGQAKDLLIRGWGKE